ncbi:hypothetical protein SAMN05421819_3917 [Bryocella elongata]|uniref:Uncharacterized protein n=1 Tax=Bryocella elongata TaxID=863522 RepID=A0A1H6BPX9_9BACT|nr:hypothetical protein SAMN05421819_3917 [Bryocella elongata]
MHPGGMNVALPPPASNGRSYPSRTETAGGGRENPAKCSVSWTQARRQGALSAMTSRGGGTAWRAATGSAECMATQSGQTESSGATVPACCLATWAVRPGRPAPWTWTAWAVLASATKSRQISATHCVQRPAPRENGRSELRRVPKRGRMLVVALVAAGASLTALDAGSYGKVLRPGVACMKAPSFCVDCG